MLDSKLAAPQGFEPRYADPESAVLPLNEGATSARGGDLQPCGVAPTKGAQCQLLHLKGHLQARSTARGTMRNERRREGATKPFWDGRRAPNMMARGAPKSISIVRSRPAKPPRATPQ